ncbi:MAG TPA: thioesterase domain-containing protein, partial [Puia sp.]|nr:thioesterase domain-containing protein [Puia sp.]
ILNDQLKLVPVGVPGNLYIGGVGVARGYANDEEKTGFAFMHDPYNNKLGERMYRTGDLGRMSPDLQMEFIGRKDNQVKIRGFRVELGEIESAIRQSALVKDVVVIAKENSERIKQLIVYAVPNEKFNKDAVVEYLKERLPEYMVPTLFMELEALPLTSNGKIDKKALPEFDFSKQLNNIKTPPRNNKEKEIVDIWQLVLHIQVGIDDNFFSLGGHSLLAVQILSKMERITEKKLPLSILFKCPTIRQLYDYLQMDNNKKSWKSLVPIKASGDKMPIYIVHGDGLNVLNINNLASHMDEEQPVYGLQPKGLLEEDQPFDNMHDIAKHYITEILEQNPSGPYALAGYSFGGYVAIEMKKQLEQMGRQVKMLAIFDTNADNLEYCKDLHEILPQKMKRQVPKFLFITKSMIKDPKKTAAYQLSVVSRKVNKIIHPHQSHVLKQSANFQPHWEKINEKHALAFRNYKMEAFDGQVVLFKAKDRMYFVDDEKHFGWNKYAKKGVVVYEVPGDHKTMLEMPNAVEFAKCLQQALDNA